MFDFLFGKNSSKNSGANTQKNMANRALNNGRPSNVAPPSPAPATPAPAPAPAPNGQAPVAARRNNTMMGGRRKGRKGSRKSRKASRNTRKGSRKN